MVQPVTHGMPVSNLGLYADCKLPAHGAICCDGYTIPCRVPNCKKMQKEKDHANAGLWHQSTVFRWTSGTHG